LAFSHPILASRENAWVVDRTIFAKQNAKDAEREIHQRLTKPAKEQSMEYLILVAVVTMMALYALIIVGCVKQPEW
jgi:hypothetical protein